MRGMRLLVAVLAFAMVGCDGGSGSGGGTPTPTPTSVPNIPTISSVVAGDGQLTILWAAVSGAASYNLYMDSAPGVTKFTTTGANFMKHTGVTSPYVHTNLTNGTKHYVVVTAVNSAGESVNSLEMSGTPVAPAPAVTWTKSADPKVQGWIHSIVIDPTNTSTLYALYYDGQGTDKEGVVQSTDGGQTWTYRNRYQGNPSIYNSNAVPNLYALALKGQTLTLGLSDLMGSSRVWTGSTTGTTWSNWQYAGFSQNSVYDINTLSVDSTVVSSTLMGAFGGLYTSGIGTWGKVNVYDSVNKMDAGPIFAIAQDQASQTIYVGTGKDVWKSTDSGVTWHYTMIGQWYVRIDALAMETGNPSVVYAGGGKIYKTTNGGQTWPTVFTPGGNVTVLVVDPTRPGTVWAATEAGVYRSTDGGSSWTAVNTGLTNLTVQSLAIDPAHSDTVYVGTKAGLFKTQ